MKDVIYFLCLLGLCWIVRDFKLLWVVLPFRWNRPFSILQDDFINSLQEFLFLIELILIRTYFVCLQQIIKNKDFFYICDNFLFILIIWFNFCSQYSTFQISQVLISVRLQIFHELWIFFQFSVIIVDFILIIQT